MAKYLIDGQTLTDIADAIREKTGETGTLTPAGMPDAIGDIQAGGGATVEEKEVNLYDFDGTLLYSYNLSELASLQSFPAPPDHEGLVFERWNWATPADVIAHGKPVDAGAIYDTDDGGLHMLIRLDDPKSLGFSFDYEQSPSKEIRIDWGDGSELGIVYSTSAHASHTYANVGEYLIKAYPYNGTKYMKLSRTSNANSWRPMFGGDKGDAHENVSASKVIRVHIGSNVEKAYSSCFAYCSQLECVTVQGAQLQEATNAFVGCASLKHINLFAVNAFAANDNAFSGCASLRSVSIGPATAKVYANAFNDCRSLKRLRLYEIESGGNYSNAFYECRSLRELELNSGTNISFGAFENCFSLASLSLPSTLTSMVATPFNNCKSLYSLTIPASVSSMNSVTSSYMGLCELHMLSSTPPTLPTYGTKPLGDDSLMLKIFVPASAVNTYKSAAGWSNYASQIYAE